jgi:acyl carrier protein
MTKNQFFALIDELLENEPGTIKGDDVLATLSRWDSLALMGFIALLDQHFGIIVPATRITACRTVDDLASLVGDRLK